MIDETDPDSSVTVKRTAHTSARNYRSEACSRGALRVCYWLFAAVAVYALLLHLLVISVPWQIEYREGAVFFQVSAALHHVPIYSMHLVPTYLNLYGSIYISLGKWLCKVIGLGYLPLRLISLVSILASVAMLYDILRLKNVDNEFRIALCANFYVALLIMTTPLARPDALGLFFYVCCFWLFQRFGENKWTLASIAVCTILGFLTKQYYVLSGPIIIAFVFFFRSRARATLYACSFLTIFVFVYWLDLQLLPGYLPLTLSVNSGATNNINMTSTLYMLRQTAAFIRAFFSSLLICASFRSWNRLSFKVIPLSVFPFASAIVALFLTLKLGHHFGAYLTYYIQLLGPVLLVAMAPSANDIAKRKPRTILLVFSLAWIVLCAAVWKSLRSPSDLIKTGREYAVLARDIGSYKNVLGDPAVVTILVRQGKTIYNSGQSYFFYGAEEPRALQLPGLSIDRMRARSIEQDYENKVSKMIARRYFNLIVTDDVGQDPLS